MCGAEETAVKKIPSIISFLLLLVAGALFAFIAHEVMSGAPLTRVDAAFAPHKTLLEVLREDLRLTGTKHGCELGECGTCAVLVDGKPVLSCLVLGLECEGRHVETVEGMAGARGLHPLQKAFADLGAAVVADENRFSCHWICLLETGLGRVERIGKES